MTNQNGQKFGLIYNGQYYYYMYNIQGDVIGIWDNNGNIVAQYNYNAWGKPISVTDGNGNDVSSNPSHIANINPIRYRGYYYDQETGFYYLQSRYYDPEVGRFINADGIIQVGQDLTGNNMFVYCGNNPVDRADPSGQYWVGNCTGTRYNTLSSTTRYHMSLYEGGISNCTWYPDPVVNNNLPKSEARKNAANNIVKTAVKELGNNYNKKYSSHPNAWCVDFANYCAEQSGLTLPGPRTSSTAQLARNYKEAGRFIAWDPNFIPSRGDIIIMNGHTGMVRDIDDTYIYTIEGNWGNKVVSRKLNLKFGGDGYSKIIGYGLNSCY